MWFLGVFEQRLGQLLVLCQAQRRLRLYQGLNLNFIVGLDSVEEPGLAAGQGFFVVAVLQSR